MLLRHSLIIVVLLLLTSCGFQPLYGSADATGRRVELSQVQVEGLSGKLGQQLKDKLEDKFNAGGNSAIKYTLKLSLERTIYPVIIDKNRGISRYRVLMKSDYYLVDITTNKTMDSGTVFVKSSYNVVPSEYATFVAEENADREGIEDLTNRFVSKLNIYFANNTKENQI